MKEKVEVLVKEAIDANKDLFLLDWSISSANHIEVLVDGDHGLPIEEIMRISRHIEHNLDRDEYDFSLTVSSPGLSRPLESPRQYIKNIGRLLQVKTAEATYAGEIEAADTDSVTLTWKAREPKPIGKGKHTVQKVEKIQYSEIESAILKVKI